MTTLAAHPFLMAILRAGDPGTILPIPPGNRDWEEVLRDAAAQRLTPLLYAWVKRSGVGEQLPVGVAARLAGQWAGLAARNMLLLHELGIILRALETARVLCAPLRGLALAERLYGDIAARPMGDLDLLVRNEDLCQVGATLRVLGFREIDRRTGFARSFSHTLEFFKDRHGWIVAEPHWTIAYPPFADRVDMEQVWRRAVKGRVAGLETWLLGPEDLLLHLCLHLTHGQSTAPLLWFYDVDQLVRQEQKTIDWSQLVSSAREAKLELFLSEILGKVRALFNTPLPRRVLELLARPPRRSVEGRLVRLLAGDSRVDGKESLTLLFTLTGFRAKLRYLLALLFPSPEFMRLEYAATSAPSLGFAYVRRSCRLGWEGLKDVMRLIV